MKSFEKFDFDVSNLKTDFEVENMHITLDDIDVLRNYADKKITINDIVRRFKEVDTGINQKL